MLRYVALIVCAVFIPLKQDILKWAMARQIEDLLCDLNSDLAYSTREECLELLKQIAETTVRIDARTAKIKAQSTDNDTARRMQTMPGIGPMTALAVEAFAPPMNCFWRGRDFAVWLGLGHGNFRQA